MSNANESDPLAAVGWVAVCVVAVDAVATAVAALVLSLFKH